LLLRSGEGDLPHYNREGWETAGSWGGGKRKTRAGVKARGGKRGGSQRSAEPCWDVPDPIRGSGVNSKLPGQDSSPGNKGKWHLGCWCCPGGCWCGRSFAPFIHPGPTCLLHPGKNHEEPGLFCSSPDHLAMLRRGRREEKEQVACQKRIDNGQKRRK